MDPDLPEAIAVPLDNLPPNTLPSNNLPADNPANPTPIEHQNVPQPHQGLHDFLYSAADEHSPETAATTPAIAHGTDAPVALTAWCDQASNAKVAGVYAVLDGDRRTQFIGYSRNVALSLRGHLATKGESTCAFVRVHPFKFPQRDAMEALQAKWIAALPSPPPGNQDGSWAASIRAAARQAMSPAEREAYEAKKLKLRRAMADGTLQQVAAQAQEQAQGQSEGDAAQRANLAAAMDDGNWSAVIREQTDETQV